MIYALWGTAGVTIVGAAIGFTLGALLAALGTFLVLGAPHAIAILTTGAVLGLIGALPGLFFTGLFLFSGQR